MWIIISNDSPIECFLEVDLEYPVDLRNDYSLADEKKSNVRLSISNHKR